MTRMLSTRHRLRAVALALACLGIWSGSSAMAAEADSAALQQNVAALQARAVALRDINDIKRLQRAYGYYTDVGQWDQVANLFAHDATLEIGLDGVYRGQARIRQYFMAVGVERRREHNYSGRSDLLERHCADSAAKLPELPSAEFGGADVPHHI